VHGQSDQLPCCARPSSAPSWTGSRSEQEKLLETYRRRSSGWRAVVGRSGRPPPARPRRTQGADLLTLGLDEISRVDPQPGEDEELRAEVQLLSTPRACAPPPRWPRRPLRAARGWR